MNKDYRDGYSFPKSVLFDLEQMKKLFIKKYFSLIEFNDAPTQIRTADLLITNQSS